MGAHPQAIYCRVSDSQAVFGIHRSTMYRLAKEGAFRIYKKGSASFVRIEEVCAWIEGRKENPK